jgi:hypothetical protein
MFKIELINNEKMQVDATGYDSLYDGKLLLFFKMTNRIKEYIIDIPLSSIFWIARV